MADKFRIYNRFPNHLDYIYVRWYDYAIGEGNDLIGTDSVGICLAITIYDYQRKKGILTHIGGFKSSPEELKPERVIDTLINRLNSDRDIDYQKLEATLSGEGWDMRRISPIVRAKLQDFGIPIIGEDLGPAPGRLVFLHCISGLVEVYRA